MDSINIVKDLKENMQIIEKKAINLEEINSFESEKIKCVMLKK